MAAALNLDSMNMDASGGRYEVCFVTMHLHLPLGLEQCWALFVDNTIPSEIKKHLTASKHGPQLLGAIVGQVPRVVARSILICHRHRSTLHLTRTMNNLAGRGSGLWCGREGGMEGGREGGERKAGRQGGREGDHESPDCRLLV
jgi:hypothetical protein